MIKWETRENISIPSDVKVSEESGSWKFKGKLGEVSRTFLDNYVRVRLEKGHIFLESSKDNRYTNGIVGTWKSEILNCIEGTTKGFTYTMKVDYTHFPTRVSVKNGKVVIENFLGERSQREALIVGSTKVSIKGDRITLTGIDKRELGETSSNIERSTKIRGFDLRIFQDGIFPIETEESE
jgi:large subunit ribosomal protein L6